MTGFRLEEERSRARLKCEQERKRLLGSHALKHGSFPACDLAGTHTYTDTCTNVHTQTGAVCGTDCRWWAAVSGSLCWARWEVAVAFSDPTTGRSIWHRHTQTEGSCKVPFKGPKANCSHTHREHSVSNMILHHGAYRKMSLHIPSQRELPAAISCSYISVTALPQLWPQPAPQPANVGTLTNNCWPKYLPTLLPNPGTSHISPSIKNPSLQPSRPSVASLVLLGARRLSGI